MKISAARQQASFHERKRRERLRREEHAEWHAAINAMTNYQRHAWNAAGSPGLKTRDPQVPRRYLLIKRRKP